MWGWISQNKDWLFSGAAIAALSVLWWFFKNFWSKREVAPVIAPAVTQAPVTTIAPVFNLGTPHVPAPGPLKVAPPVAASVPKPKPKANVCIEAVKFGKIALEGDIWTTTPHVGWERLKIKRALMVDVSNIPTDEAHTAKAEIRAAIRMEYGGQVRTYSPLPWLEEYTNKIYLDVGARKTVILAVGEDNKTGPWHFVLNHRAEHYGTGDPTAMDWTNVCPIPSDLPFEILLIDMKDGTLLRKFTYVWTFDAEYNRPFLKTPQ
jgi:hypothetical protein